MKLNNKVRMSSTQMKAVTWGWRSYNGVTSDISNKNNSPLWVSVVIAFAIVMLAGLSLHSLHVAITTVPTQTPPVFELAQSFL